jgi:hypothetical protein
MKEKSIILILIISLILLVSLAACNPKQREENKKETIEGVKKTEEPIEYTREEIMKDFRDILKSKNEPMSLVEFTDENIAKVEKEDAVEMIMGLENTQIEYVEKYTDEIFTEDYQSELLRLWELNSTESLFLNMDEIEEVKNEGLKELLGKLKYGKYKLIMMEGALYPIIDYEAMKGYDKYLDDETKSYLDIKSLESNSPSLIDAAIYVSFDELAARLIKVEDHIKKYPEGSKNEELLRLYSTYLKLYLSGSDNSPIYNYEDKVILEEVLNSYKKTAKNQNSITGEITNKYKEIIENNNNIIDENVLSKITECHNEAIAKLEASK